MEDAEDFKEGVEAGADGNNRTLGRRQIHSLQIPTTRFRLRIKPILSNSNKIPTTTYVGLEHTTNIVGHMGHADIHLASAGCHMRIIVGKQLLTIR